ncbi:MAG: hypothetical protein ACKN9T_10540 [Candidatus Methylumidiphilus sp.]
MTSHTSRQWVVEKARRRLNCTVSATAARMLAAGGQTVRRKRLRKSPWFE